MTALRSAESEDHSVPGPRPQSTAGGLLWLIGGRFTNLAMSIVSTAILSRFLTPEQFGQLVPVLIVISLSVAVFDGTFGVGIIRSQQLELENVRVALGNCLFVATILVATLLIGSPLIERFFHFRQLSELIAAASLVVLLRAVFAIASAVLQRERRYKEISLASTMAAPFGSLLVAVPLAIAGFGAWSLLIGTISQSLVETAIVAHRARLPWRFSITRAGISELGSMEGYFALNQLLNWAALSSANVVAGHYLSLSQLGFYSRSWRLLDIAVAATSTPLQRVLVPIFAGLQANTDDARIKFEQALAIAVPAFAVAGTLACMHAEAMVRLLLGDQWIATIPLVQVLFSALVARCGYKISESVLVGFGRARSAAIRQFAYFLMLSGGAVIAVRWQALGIAVSTSAAVWLFYLISITQAMTLLGTRWSTVLMIHLRAAMLVTSAVLFHYTVASLASAPGYWLGEVIIGSADAVFIIVVTLLAPPWLVGAMLQTFVRKRGAMR
ncbi:oligosaccharide flippase family protein [Sphingomonas sp. BIUV-7]|uniref:Oligosaccharide flippase family protein n=1 Tax=Sphingomonas natans TaxID=3063330 RepID=A0ABT8YCM6_9SPHN|nr:oligosaccharide flippase family protein [Sphingomonas sp. BIUV-7]MDO6416074.1 oligosaccharide flippase family protein [Sphingomonas sp. BIUV-7]